MHKLLAQVSIKIPTPSGGINPNADPGKVLSNVITIIFVVAAFLVLVMLILGAFQWITSGGEKEGVQKAREKILNALIGFAVLALAFLIVSVVGQLLHINVFNLTLPALDTGA